MPTPAQIEAIENPGNTVVMAGAGTGKTSTLVNRVLHWIRQSGGSIERMLMVTFTEASAAEMRQRLRKSLAESLRAADESEADHLNEQLALLEQAQISTLHSFCLRLVREHFHVLGIDPDVRVLDEQQTRPLEERVLEEMIREHLSGRHSDSPAVQRLLRRYLGGNENSLRDWIRKIHRFARTLAEPAAWFDREVAAAEQDSAPHWEEWLTADVRAWQTKWIPILEPLRSENEFVEVALKTVSAIPADGGVVEIGMAMSAIVKPARAWKRGTEKWLKDAVDPCYKEAAAYSRLLGAGPEGSALAEDWNLIRHQVTTLLTLTREFGRRFDLAKRELGGIDFADQEQLALELLRNEEAGVAANCRESFLQVFIDEAQDINHAQDAILSAVSNRNRFIVGDIKQCIYQFRLTDPRIFDRYAREWTEGGAEGRTIALVENFRSHEGVVNFVNGLFDSLMLPEVGGVDYQSTARLEFGAREERVDKTVATDPAARRRVEINLLATDPDDSSADPDDDDSNLMAIELEARLVAQRLRRMMDEGVTVADPDTNESRAVRWSDMAVLLRSPGPCAESFVREFRRFGIPLQAKRAGFYAALEVQDLINLLRLLDNPRQDIPLLAVLHSPLVGLDLEELGWLRANDREESIWRCVKGFVEAGEPTSLRDKLAGFLKSFAEWRALSRQSSLSHCLEVILEQTHYESLLLIGERGAERMGNVRRLLDLARQYDPFQRQGLHRFVRFVEAQEEASMDLEPAPPSVTEAVALMSIHQSKGLEFPVVVAAGLGRKFNEQDVNAALVVDEEFGVCLHVHPHGPEQRYASLPLQLARKGRRRELRAEELRLLYVACTRAKDRLILTGTIRATVEKFADLMDKELNGERIAAAKGMTDWLFPWLGRRVGSSEMRGIADTFGWEFWSAEDERLKPADPGSGETESIIVQPSLFLGVDLDRLADRLEFVYPHEGATIEAAKTSVSELRKRATEDDEVSRPRYAARSGFASGGLKTGKISAAERGTLHHRFLQKIELDRAGSPQELRSQAHLMREAEDFTDAEFAAIDYEALAELWVSPLGRMIRETVGRIERELPFTVRLGLRDLQSLELVGDGIDLTAGEFVVVQGVVDLAVMEDDGIVVLDYKTDSMGEADVGDKLKQYGPQLRLYAHALEAIYRQPVKGAWLHFLAIGRSVDVLVDDIQS
jgi:ATP-dependent helicase/nuclease subunit A